MLQSLGLQRVERARATEQRQLLIVLLKHCFIQLFIKLIMLVLSFYLQLRSFL